MVVCKCLGHDSRHVCRSLCWRREGGFYIGKRLLCKGVDQIPLFFDRFYVDFNPVEFD